MARLLNGFETCDDAAKGLDQVHRRLLKTEGLPPDVAELVEDAIFAARKAAREDQRRKHTHGKPKKTPGGGSRPSPSPSSSPGRKPTRNQAA